MATMTFEHITDSRFDQDEALLEHWVNKTSAALADLPVEVRILPTRLINWSGTDKPFLQWRTRFYVSKYGRTPNCTWDDVYRAINTVHAETYRFIK